jgi:hypothetical protein
VPLDAVHAPGVLAEPAPDVFVKDFADSAAYSPALIDDFRNRSDRRRVRARVWYAARRPTWVPTPSDGRRCPPSRRRAAAGGGH